MDRKPQISRGSANFRDLSPFVSLLLFFLTSGAIAAGNDGVYLPIAAAGTIDFVREIKPLFESSCIQCHGKGKNKGDFSLETRDSLLKGGENGPAAIPGNSKDSLIVRMVSGGDPDKVMPQKGSKWTAEQIGLLRAWIDQGLKWDAGINFARPEPVNLKPRAVTLPPGGQSHPLDRILSKYFESRRIQPPAVVEDRLFARRVYLDVVGLLPTPEQLEAFLRDGSTDKRATLVHRLLADDYGYADHWLTFWNDLLRNDYKGAGYIDGGRKQVTGWVYAALLTNKPYDQFVAELVEATAETEGFTNGIIWRGNVNASQTQPLQAAQCVSQVFFGINLKCASCHDSFVSDWTLADAYGLAAIYSDKPLELVRCDKPTGKSVSARFLYPQIGEMDPTSSRADRLQQFARIMTRPTNGRLPRTLVNRLWARLMGRGLVEPIDDMEKPAWNADMLDWLAEDLAAHQFDVKQTLERILTSQAYQLPTVESPAERAKQEFIFHGPLTRRMTAEQFADAISSLTNRWAKLPASPGFDFAAGGKCGELTMPRWIWTKEPVEVGIQRGRWQLAKTRMDAANKLAIEAEKLVLDGDPKAVEVTARAKAAALEASRVVAEAEATSHGAEAAADASPVKVENEKPPIEPGEKPREEVTVVPAPLVRHRVVFRRKFALDALPDGAIAVISASQRSSLAINGKGIPVASPEKFSPTRSQLYDIRSALREGENVVVVTVDSHTESPGPRNAEDENKAGANHLNSLSGMAFYARCFVDGPADEWISDNSWRVYRSPDAGANTDAFDDSKWPIATLLPDRTGPTDEGPALDRDGNRLADKHMLALGPGLRALVSVPTRTGHIRAGLLASDSLQSAMDRPNRDQIMSVRSTTATTIQALEFANGATLDDRLKSGAAKLLPLVARNPSAWLDAVYRHAFSRPPTDVEREIAGEMLGSPVKSNGIADFLWTLTVLPEFQYLN